MSDATRGRPKQFEDKRFGYTLRLLPELRKYLKQLAQEKTDVAGQIVTVHEVIMEAITDMLRRHRFPV